MQLKTYQVNRLKWFITEGAFHAFHRATWLRRLESWARTKTKCFTRILCCNEWRTTKKKLLINFIKSIGSALDDDDHFKVLRWNLPSFIDLAYCDVFMDYSIFAALQFANEYISTYLNSSPLITESVTHSHFFISISSLFAAISFETHTNSCRQRNKSTPVSIGVRAVALEIRPNWPHMIRMHLAK